MVLECAALTHAKINSLPGIQYIGTSHDPCRFFLKLIVGLILCWLSGRGSCSLVVF